MDRRTAGSTSARRPCSRRMLKIAWATDLERGVGQPLRFVEVADQLRPGAAQQRRPPQPDRPLQRLGELRRRGDLDVGALDVAELEQVDHGPAGAFELELGIAGLLGDAPQLGRDLEPLVDRLRPPQRVVAGVEARRERARVAEPACQVHGLL